MIFLKFSTNLSLLVTSIINLSLLIMIIRREDQGRENIDYNNILTYLNYQNNIDYNNILTYLNYQNNIDYYKFYKQNLTAWKSDETKLH